MSGCSCGRFCTEIDEVYTGFRLAPGGAQEIFGGKADLVTYGKIVAGGNPIGVVCGPKRLMKRSDWQRHHQARASRLRHRNLCRRAGDDGLDAFIPQLAQLAAGRDGL